LSQPTSEETYHEPKLLQPLFGPLLLPRLSEVITKEPSALNIFQSRFLISSGFVGSKCRFIAKKKNKLGASLKNGHILEIFSSLFIFTQSILMRE